MYPDNWVLSDQGDVELPRVISLETPDGAIWSVHLFSPDVDPDLIIKDTVNALEETYPDLEVSTAEHSFAQHPGTAIDTIFFCLDFLVRIKLMTLQTDQYQVLAWYQAEDRDFDKQEQVFHAVTTSMMQSLAS